MKNHFFLMKTIDAERKFAPENKIIMDVPSALNIFSAGGIHHLVGTVRDKVLTLCSQWNDMYAGVQVFNILHILIFIINFFPTNEVTKNIFRTCPKRLVVGIYRKFFQLPSMNFQVGYLAFLINASLGW